MRISPATMYADCYGRYAIAAVNVFTMEQVHGLFAAAEKYAAPIIVQITPAARQYAHPVMLTSMVEAAAQIYHRVIYALHLDHGFEATISSALDEGYTSVMIDASHDPFEENVRRTASVVQAAHQKNIVVEAELGVLSGVEDDLEVAAKHAFYTNPQQAAEFVRRTGCDSLAVAVGTSHGAYKFSGSQGLQLQRLADIQAALPGCPLVLHGSSAVDKAEVEKINQFGGRIKKDASGVPDHQLVAAIPLGVCKVNIATDLRLLWTRVHREFFYTTPEQFDPIVPGKKYMEAYINFMSKRFDVLGCKNKSHFFNQTDSINLSRQIV